MGALDAAPCRCGNEPDGKKQQTIPRHTDSRSRRRRCRTTGRAKCPLLCCPTKTHTHTHTHTTQAGRRAGEQEGREASLMHIRLTANEQNKHNTSATNCSPPLHTEHQVSGAVQKCALCRTLHHSDSSSSSSSKSPANENNSGNNSGNNNTSYTATLPSMRRLRSSFCSSVSSVSSSLTIAC